MEIKDKIQQIEKQVGDLEKKMQAPDFWQNQKQAIEIQKQHSALKQILDLASKATSEQEMQKALLSGKYDRGEAILSVYAGAGGRDAEDWTALVLKMYQKYCQKKAWAFQILSESFGEGGGPEGRIGVKEASMEIKGNFAYGLLKKEAGVHRLVRISPFSAKKLRHTSFCRVEVMPKISEDDSVAALKPGDLKIETFRASGHGGQNVNKRETAVRITHLPTGVSVSAQNERLQAQNRRIAMEVLLGKLFKLKEQEQEKEMARVKGEVKPADFGNQIRSYVLHPYQLVKDHRVNIETSNVEAVLEGDLDKFIQAELKIYA